ncbi:serine/threonine-protein kinase [Streptomyces sp. NPDC046712]|uniref:serine/threonine-protein kinase n=1 Tax=Streptomyces sp. NPDC046712 TaxID=3154802 RepID=UPI0033F6EAFF
MLSPLTHADPAAIATYRLLARLGSGGMGTVYLARTPGGRTVALKTMHARLASEADFRTRFRLETDAARIIGARHGAAVVDADPLAETPWLATEYVLGPPLDDAVSLCGRLPEPTVRALGAALAGALAQLHSSDVVHRDLKPSNVLVTAYGPKIIDFGIARAAGDDRLTSTGAAAGTPAFMSPEQAGGQEHTPAGDVFALAGVLVFAATGHGPFGTGAPADLLYRVRYAEPDLTGVPESLLPVLTACLSKDPSTRPTTTDLAAHLHDGRGEFADHLPPHLLTDIAHRATQVWLHHPHRLPAPEDDPYAPTSTPARPALSRRKLLATGGGSLLGLGGVGAGVWAWLAPDGDQDKADAKPKTPATPTKTPVEEVGPLRTEWTSDAAGATGSTPPIARDSVVMTMIKDGLQAFESSGELKWTRNELIHDDQVVAGEKNVYGLIADEVNGLTIFSVDANSGERERTVAMLADFKHAWIPGLSKLLYASDDTIYLAVDRKKPEATPGTYDWCLIALDTGTGKERWRVPIKESEPGHGFNVYFARAVGNRLLVGQATIDMTLTAYDTRSGKVLWRRVVPEASTPFVHIPTSGSEVAEDGMHIYVGAEFLYAFRLSDGHEIWKFGHNRDYGDLRSRERHYGAPLVRGGLVYAVEGTRTLVAVDSQRGELAWQTDVTAGGTPSLEVPPVAGATVLCLGNEQGVGVVDLAAHRYAQTLASGTVRLTAAGDRWFYGVGNESLKHFEAQRKDQ